MLVAPFWRGTELQSQELKGHPPPNTGGHFNMYVATSMHSEKLMQRLGVVFF